MPHPVILEVPNNIKGEVSSLCCSSISESTMFMSPAKTISEEKKKKVLGRKYSKLAYNIQKAVEVSTIAAATTVPKDVNEHSFDELSSFVSLDSSLSSGDISFGDGCIVSFQDCAHLGGEKKKKKNQMKKLFQRKSTHDHDNDHNHENNHKGILAEPCTQNCINIGGIKKKKKKGFERKYSKLAFSVQQVGSVVKTEKKMPRWIQ